MRDRLFTRRVRCPFGPILLAVDPAGALVRLAFDPPAAESALAERASLDSDPARTAPAERQLREYLSGDRRGFELALAPEGTPFQRQVWRALQRIPYGETRSYGAIAASIGRPGAARAVGAANHANPIAIVIPCHRVVGADGRLTGFGGGLPTKQWLLEHEDQGATLFARSPR